MSWNRGKRLEALLKEWIATIIVERLSDPRIGFTTITRVELSRDKKHARVYYTCLGEPEQQRTTRRGLEAAAPHIQEALAPNFKARNLPELRFVYDTSIMREATMLNLLGELAEERAERGDDGELVDEAPGGPSGADNPEADELDDAGFGEGFEDDFEDEDLDGDGELGEDDPQNT
jgi:ribosome-binding factor A